MHSGRVRGMSCFFPPLYRYRALQFDPGFFVFQKNVLKFKRLIPIRGIQPGIRVEPATGTTGDHPEEFVGWRQKAYQLEARKLVFTQYASVVCKRSRAEDGIHPSTPPRE